ncbi:hypothetical protein WJX73_004156 [Symbiochloris irregularis]|uniref:Helicase C-terminal domain-containing protein n=1 Tax=Symbiochloris irregularis TaxID=706552 RepID=A0AAW1NSS9_9CHLO
MVQRAGAPSAIWPDAGMHRSQLKAVLLSKLASSRTPKNPLQGLSAQIEAVVRRIKWLTNASLAAKVLVFSTWQDVVDVVAHALRANHLPFAYARGRKATEKAIQQFKSGALSEQSGLGGARPIQTLLLLVKQGGNGLNLTEAQHVVMVEPLLDPAVEQQAVGRVHRIGQTHPTQVHRFVIESSIEESVRQISSERAAVMDLSAAAAEQAPKAEQQSLTIRDVGKLLQQHWTQEAAAERSSIAATTVPA